VKRLALLLFGRLLRWSCPQCADTMVDDDGRWSCRRCGGYFVPLERSEEMNGAIEVPSDGEA
jgi:hypothetical protein